MRAHRYAGGRFAGLSGRSASWRGSIGAAAVLLACATAGAQAPSPSLTFIFPPGGAAGTELDLVLHGANLAGVDDLRFSHPGISAVLKDGSVFHVRIGRRVPRGVHAVQAVSRLGASGPRAFHVDDLTEAAEKEGEPEPMRIAVDSTVSGAIGEAADEDRFTVPLSKGRRVFIDCWARRLDARWDATLRLLGPGGREVAWNRDFFGEDPFIDFTASSDGDHTIVLHDFLHKGSPQSVYRLRVTARPYIDFAIPACVPRPSADDSRDGLPVIEVLGRGLPGGRPAGHHWLDGKPLDVLQVPVRAPGHLPGFRLRFGGSDSPAVSGIALFDFALPVGGSTTNSIPLGVSDSPIVVETEPNDPWSEGGKAQEIELPFDMTGQFSGPRDVDGYEFSARKGETLWIEIIAKRMGSEADPVVTIEKAAEPGKDPEVLRELDDEGERLHEERFDTRSFDPQAAWSVPEDGRYRILVRDGSRKKPASSEAPLGLFYRLVVRPSRPDFELILLPGVEGAGSVTVPRGGRGYYEVHAVKREGYAEPIRAHAIGFPVGVESSGAHLGPGASFAPIVFAAGPDAPLGAEAVEVSGHGAVGGRRTGREARPYAISAAKTPNLVRPVDEALLGVSPGPAPFRIDAEPARLGATPGSRVTVKIALTREAPFDGPVEVAPIARISGVKGASAKIEKEKTEAALEIAIEPGALPGRYTIAFRADAEAPFVGAPGQKPQTFKARAPSNPITLDIIAAPFEITLPDATEGRKLPPGGSAAVRVEVARRHGFQGDVAISLVPPEGAAWLSAAEAQVPRRRDSTSLEVRAGADAPPGRIEASVRASGVFLGQPVAREAKLVIDVEPATPAAAVPAAAPASGR